MWPKFMILQMQKLRPKEGRELAKVTGKIRNTVARTSWVSPAQGPEAKLPACESQLCHSIVVKSWVSDFTRWASVS